jgi:hypothetical protein
MAHTIVRKIDNFNSAAWWQSVIMGIDILLENYVSSIWRKNKYVKIN